MTRLNTTIGAVAPGSIGDDLGILPGDRILEVNGKGLYDILQFQYAASEPVLTLTVERGDERTVFEIEKDAEDELGLSFQEDLFDGIRRCKNNCVFCFVYQNPRGLRKSLYIKDEDFRYSFMYGNYVTLTNMSEEDMNRIVKERLSPIYVSVHATDQEVRDVLLGRNTPPIFPRLDFLVEHGIEFYAQLVLCPGLNDGAILEKSLKDLERYRPSIRGITGVPVGLTRYRDHLFPLRTFDPEGARQMIAYAREKQKQLLDRHGTRLFFLSDEFYLKAGVPFPADEEYEEFHSVQDGVGMIPLFLRDLKRVLPRYKKKPAASRKATIITGVSAGWMFREKVFPMLEAAGWPVPRLHVVKNEFFGGGVNVAGLLTGRDIEHSLEGEEPTDFAMICDYMLRTGTEIFLDDMTVTQLSARIGMPIYPVTDSPSDMLAVFRDGRPSAHRRTRSGWEAESSREEKVERFHDLPAGDSSMLKPLFDKPNAVWGRK